jgi:ribosomal protein S20
LAHSSRTWTGARTPQAIKRVRQAARKRLVNQPRKSAAKTLVSKAVALSATGDAESTVAAMTEAVSALDRAAKAGAIHRNAADRRKSRLMLKINAALGGEALSAAAKPVRSTGKLAAAKAAKARVAAGKASKAKGEQTAAGKARAALTRSTRETKTAAVEDGAAEAEVTPARTRGTAGSKANSGAKAGTAKAGTARASAVKTSAKAAAAPKASSTGSKSTPTKASARKS